MSNDKPASRATTPEEYFTPRPNPEEEIPVDALLCSLARADSIITLLMYDSEIKDSTIAVNALWCARGILDQARIMVKHSVGIGEVKT